MSIRFNDEVRHAIIIEDVDNDEENYDNFDLVEDTENEVMFPQPQFVPLRPPPPQTPKFKPKPQISYDDILKSMNMQVKDGKLEMIHKNDAKVSYQNNAHAYQNNYEHQEQQRLPSRQLTIHERRALFIKRQIEIENQRRRINQIKSKKLNFAVGNINISPMHAPNRLFKLTGNF